MHYMHIMNNARQDTPADGLETLAAAADPRHRARGAPAGEDLRPARRGHGALKRFSSGFYSEWATEWAARQRLTTKYR